MSISKLLFGEIALKKKLVTQEQVEECLLIQKKMKEMGITKTLGAVMHDKKFLSMVEIKEILREMTGTKDWNAIEGYEIVGKLGKGGMGSVYKARHSKLGRMVALKVLPPELAGDQEYLDRFNREARAAAKLNHPNIVQALDVGESYGYHYFVMEFVEGATVKEMIERQGCVPEIKAIDVIEQVCDALVHAWKNGIIHRDIKPSNIIVNSDGVAKLCDLGLAKTVTEDSQITQTGVIMGTPFYLSPEQARSEELDIRSDIYSLGVTLFHMVTGQVPFTGNSAATILYKHIFLDPPKPRSLNPNVSSELSQLIMRTLAKPREDRPEDPEALLAELRVVREEIAARLPPEEKEPPRGTSGAAAAAAAAAAKRDGIDTLGVAEAEVAEAGTGVDTMRERAATESGAVRAGLLKPSGEPATAGKGAGAREGGSRSEVGAVTARARRGDDTLATRRPPTGMPKPPFFMPRTRGGRAIPLALAVGLAAVMASIAWPVFIAPASAGAREAQAGAPALRDPLVLIFGRPHAATGGDEASSALGRARALGREGKLGAALMALDAATAPYYAVPMADGGRGGSGDANGLAVPAALFLLREERDHIVVAALAQFEKLKAEYERLAAPGSGASPEQLEALLERLNLLGLPDVRQILEKEEGRLKLAKRDLAAPR